MIPYSTQNISEEDLDAVRAVLLSGWLTQGPAVPRFEERFGTHHKVKHSVAVSSATAGLHLACLALDLGPGSIVWTTPNTFVASANCARYCGATVDFVDIDACSRNMSVSALERKLAAARVSGTLPDVVIPVDFAGFPCDLREIRSLADEYRFKIIEDASHAVGARYREQPVGAAYADLCVFSFHPVKIITTTEGGLVATQDATLAEKLRLLRSHGITRDPALMTQYEGDWYYEQLELGFNYRMNDISAALGCSQLDRLSVFHDRRCALAARYDDLLADLPLILPPRSSDRVSSHHLYVVEIDESRSSATRSAVFAQLRAMGIGVNVHYIPVHLQPYYRRMGFLPGAYPDAERYYARALSLPLYPALTESQQDEVVRALARTLAQ